MRRIHLDTDLGSDTDDLCALAMLLGWPDVDLIGITTSADVQGLRVGFIEYVLRLADRSDIPVAAGADGSLAGFRTPVGFPNVNRYWPEPIAPRPTPPGEALDLLVRSIEAGAMVVAIGPFTPESKPKSGGMGGGTKSAQLLEALDWATAENRRSDSKYYGKVNP